MNNIRPKIGVFSFTSCEGCQLQILNLEDELPALTGQVEFVNFREAMSERSDNYDIAFVEGSITRDSEIPVLRDIRKRAAIIIAMGACAHTGGVNNLKNRFPKEVYLKRVYSRTDIFTDTTSTRRLSDIIDVDFTIPGCPIDKDEFVRFVQALLLGTKPYLPDYPVCLECRSKGNICLVERGEWCLGAVTMAGCDAACPTYGESCAGCRGIMKNSNIESLLSILRDNGFSGEDITKKMELFNMDVEHRD